MFMHLLIGNFVDIGVINLGLKVTNRSTITVVVVVCHT